MVLVREVHAMSKKSRTNKSTFPARYTGELATPIYEPVGGSKPEAERRAFEQRLLKMDQLFNWYSIDPGEPDAWMYLAVRLASEHVPGMQVRHKRRGRKRTWKDGLGIELVCEVAALRQDKKLTYKQAIETLRRNKEKRWRSHTFANLITRHREARKVEQRRRHLVEQLKTLRISQAMGTVFGVDLTDENSSD
jgi:hypothetical protein